MTNKYSADFIEGITRLYFDEEWLHSVDDVFKLTGYTTSALYQAVYCAKLASRNH